MSDETRDIELDRMALVDFLEEICEYRGCEMAAQELRAAWETIDRLSSDKAELVMALEQIEKILRRGNKPNITLVVNILSKMRGEKPGE